MLWSALDRSRGASFRSARPDCRARIALSIGVEEIRNLLERALTLSFSPEALLAAAGEGGIVVEMMLALALIVAFAKVMGGLAARLGQPTVLGELLAGLLLGPTVLDLFSNPVVGGEQAGEVVHLMGQIGVILLMFAAGLEIELSDLRASGRPAALSGVMGVIVPTGMGYLLGLAFSLPPQESLFIGVTLSATSVSISAQTLLELGRLRTREGFALMGAAVIDDVLVIILLAALTALLAGGGGLAGVAIQLARMVVVLLAVSGVAIFLLPRLVEASTRIPASEALLSFAVSAALVLAWAVEFIGGVAAITGAFLAGLGLSSSHLRDDLERGLHRLAYSLFVPLFLVDIGLQANLRALPRDALLLGASLIVVAVISKVAGSGLGAFLGGFDLRRSFRMGLGMISRGEVGLIVAGVGASEGLLPPELFSLMVMMVLVTTLITPPLLRWSFAREEASDAIAG